MMARLIESEYAKLGVVFRAPKEGNSDISLPDAETVGKSPEAPMVSNLELMVAQQVDRLVQFGFHEELGKSEEEYRAEFLPLKGVSQPESYKGLFDILLVVEPRIALGKQHLRAGIKEVVSTDTIQNLTEFPNKPYITWTQDGQKTRNCSAELATEYFKDDEIGSPQVEVTALYLQHPEYFKGLGIVAAGSRYEDGYVPCLGAFSDRPEVCGFPYDLRLPVWGVGYRGKEIVILGA